MINAITIPFNIVEFQKYPYGGIYFIYNSSNILLYIGQTNNISYRLSNYYRKQTHLCFTDASKVEILRVDNDKERKLKEKELIRKYLPPMNYSCTGGLSQRCKSKKRDNIKCCVSLDKDIYDKIKDIGETEDRSFSQQVNKILKDFLKEKR